MHWSPRKGEASWVVVGLEVLMKEQSSEDTLTWDFSRSFQTFQVFETYFKVLVRLS